MTPAAIFSRRPSLRCGVGLLVSIPEDRQPPPRPGEIGARNAILACKRQRRAHDHREGVGPMEDKPTSSGRELVNAARQRGSIVSWAHVSIARFTST
jgi:hypothetical protein